VTPPHIQKGKALEIQVIHPTPSHAAPEQEWVDDPPNRPPTDDDAKQLAELFYNLTNLHKKWDSKPPMMHPSPEGLIELPATINDLVRDNPMPSMAGIYPKTPRKPSRPSAAYPASRSAPNKLPRNPLDTYPEPRVHWDFRDSVLVYLGPAIPRQLSLLLRHHPLQLRCLCNILQTFQVAQLNQGLHHLGFRKHHMLR